MKVFVYLSVICSLILTQNIAHANTYNFKKHEDSMMVFVDSMNRIAVHGERIEYCHDVIKQLSTMLKQPNSYQYGFETLAKKVHIIYPEDKSFRIFNWPVEYAPARFRYYGVIQTVDGKLFPLVDYSERLDEQSALNILDNKTWYGQEIYNILSRKDIDGNSLYFVLGVNHNNSSTSVKMMDVMRFTADKVVFGGPYFEGSKNRFILEYQKGAQVSLNYNAEKGMVIYNVLESEVNHPKRKNTLVPSGEIDGFKWEKGQWHSERNIVPILKLRDGQAPLNGVIPTN